MYIILEKSNTRIGKIGRLLGSYPYTHIAISFDNENFLSFSRRKHHNPFDSGYTIEKLHYYAYEDVELKYYELDINDNQRKSIEEFIDSIKDYPFDVYGMILSSIGIYRKKDNAYNCMSYMAKILEILDIPLIHKEYYKNSIKDLEDALIKKGYKGEIKEIKKMIDEDNYMEKISLNDKIKSFINLHRKLMKK